ncbi:MAG: 4-hydroxythreonine-4-phosphate dehydrogenase PdxA [SAR86 cluster bacterium]|nr:4-hydroxythreonine-4-phosphate dehydrogenase PdxA [Gammaproteobacteria bacterium]MDC3228073.1 4-hydroxythreonine-4-phosphate dehydrogenase PdxA [Gammaproteobacteria bacterium]MDG1061370.1 4-hydroxythreonine-4-phosphate dehydrogenase PdxA [SAR86 cluster bacterium]MDG1961294.1 4-hydroxythreonine-4-phosphate dehydrogenase PdxA [SAR86 cluster bacterium]
MNRLLYSHGEPAGIGIDLILHLSKSKFWQEMRSCLICIVDFELLKSRAKLLNLKIQFVEIKSLKLAKKNKLGTVQFIQSANCKDLSPGSLNPKNAKYVLDNLNFGIAECLKKQRVGLVTGPIQKSNIIDGGFKTFQGHTEWIQKKTKSKNVVMLLSSKNIKVALATTHIPLTEVAKNIRKAKLIEIIQTLHTGLKTKFKIKKPSITVLGLNPHAGEDGKIGEEEIKKINPAVEVCRGMGINASYAISADTAFTAKKLKQTDAYLAMYHDQALPVLKALSFGEAVNITLGTGIVRTSVDHGTALDIAGKMKPNLGSIKEAIKAAEVQLK